MTTTEVPPLPDPISTSLTFSSTGNACNAETERRLHGAAQALLALPVPLLQCCHYKRAAIIAHVTERCIMHDH